MVPRPLGRSGLRVSPIGFGAFKIGRNQGIKYAQGYELPDDAAVGRLLHGVLDLGINLIDTAPAYGLSEERIGQALAERRREFVLSTKVGETFVDGRSQYDFSAGGVRASVERSLRRLRTDVLDILLIHAHADDLRILTQTDAVPALRQLRQEGLVRLIGLSGKTVAAARHTLDWADVLMVEYHAKDRSHADVIAAAAAAGVGVLVKKALASGTLAAPEALRAALGPAGVSSVVVGTLRLEHLRENVRLAEEFAAPAQ